MPGVGSGPISITFDAGGDEAGLERGLEHVARQARVLADEHACRPRAPARAPRRSPAAARNPPSSGARRPGRARRRCRSTCVAIKLSPCMHRRGHAAPHRRVAATSCARTMRAPLSTAMRGQRDAAGEPLVRRRARSVCRASTCATARPAAAGRRRPAPGRPRSSCQIVLQGLAEAESRVERDALGADAGRAAGGDALARGRRCTSRHHVVVAGAPLHGARLALHVHQAHGAAACRAPPPGRPGARSARTSLMRPAPAAAAARMTSGLLVSTEMTRRARARSRSITGRTRSQLLRGAHRLARPGASTRRRRR